MKRLLVLALCVLPMTSLSTASAAPEWQVSNGITASAMWTQPIPGTPRYDVYWAFGVQGFDGEEVVTMGGLGHFRCSSDRWGIVQLFCFRGALKKLTAGEFTIDPALGEANLTIDRKGMTGEVTWTASDTPTLFQDALVWGPSYYAGATIRRTAEIDATIMGESFRGKGQRWFADMRANAGAAVYNEDLVGASR